ncbi:MAG: DUF4340 domain-containing protein [Bacteroidota bacterium]|nr:DUF4340 domain-containing protein [Bacteroidota bacterium]
MKTNSLLILVFIFLGLGGISWYFLNSRQTTHSNGSLDRHFAIKDIDNVQKIFLAKRGSSPITLEKNDGIWYVNGKYKAFPSAIKNLLEVMQHVSMASIPPRPAYEEIMKEFAAFGLKVEAYAAGNKHLKTYYIGGVTNDESGVYFLMDKSVQPYIMHLASTNSNIRYRYDLQLEDWRDRSLFALHESDIQSIKLEYPFHPESSFELLRNKKKFNLVKNGMAQELSILNDPLIQLLPRQFEQVGTEAFENKNPEKETISKIKPYCTIDIELVERERVVVNLYPINEETNEVDMSKDFLVKSSFFRFYAARNDGDFFLVQLRQLSKIMLKYEDFVKK